MKACDNIHMSTKESSFCEQTFDYDHIFEFDFFDDDFKSLENFSVDG